MTKKLKKATTFLSAVAMVMAMLLNFQVGMFSIDFGHKASAATIEPSAPTEGDGTSTNPYKIGTASELYWFADKINNENSTYGSASAVLTADIAVNENVPNENGELNGTNFTSWTPIGNSSSNIYTGIFDGKGFTVSGLYFNNTSSFDYIGLFGFNSGSISNIGVADSCFRAKLSVGGVCGNNNGTVTNCYNMGTVYGMGNVGGVCGENFGTLTNCYNTGTVSTTTNTAYGGGVCGNNACKIINCYNTGKVSGTSNVGALCGSDSGTVTKCYYLANCNAEGTTFDCIVGESKTASEFSGGTVCENLGYHSHRINGLCSLCRGDYEPAKETTDKYDIDGVEGFDTVYEISNAGQLYWFAALVNNDTTHAEFDAQNKSANAVLTADITVNTGNVAGCNGVKAYGWIDWTPVGSSSARYMGTFDGQGYTVSGLYFNDDTASYVGLFGCIISTGRISDVNVENFWFKGYDYAGGVCGSNDGSGGTIKNCKSSGEVSAAYFNANVGGVCGCNAGTVTNCENSAKAGAAGSQAYVGGVCGNNYGILTNCENSGEVSSDGNGAYVGGICGNNSSNGAVKNCYNIGNVSGTSDYVSKVCGYNDGGTVANCYYLAQTEDGNGGKTEEQFTSGEVAYLLSQGTDGSVWGQTLGESGDAYPALN